MEEAAHSEQQEARYELKNHESINGNAERAEKH